MILLQKPENTAINKHLFPQLDRLAYHVASASTSLELSGFTLDPTTLREPAVEDIYYVSLKGFEDTFNHRPKFNEVLQWLNRHLATLYRPGHYIGGWHDNNTFYLDISIAIKGREEALQIAAENEQKAIFNPHTDETIYLQTEIPFVA